MARLYFPMKPKKLDVGLLLVILRDSRVPLKITPKPLFTNKLTFTIFNLVTKRGFLYGPAQLFRPERQT